jgi:hypothetical protein
MQLGCYLLWSFGRFASLTRKAELIARVEFGGSDESSAGVVAGGNQMRCSLIVRLSIPLAGTNVSIMLARCHLCTYHG